MYVRWHAAEALMEHMGRGPLSRAESEDAFGRHLQHWKEHGFGLLVIEDKETGALVGRSGLHYHRIWPDEPEVGWLIETAWQGRGFATEAGAACVTWAFDQLGFDRLVSICTPDNLASRRVMQKLGFVLERDVEDPLLAISLCVHVLGRARAATFRSGV
jgi:RimJ/RimL family protein N-acetyltransferase